MSILKKRMYVVVVSRFLIYSTAVALHNTGYDLLLAQILLSNECIYTAPCWFMNFNFVQIKMYIY